MIPNSLCSSLLEGGASGSDQPRRPPEAIGGVNLLATGASLHNGVFQSQRKLLHSTLAWNWVVDRGREAQRNTGLPSSRSKETAHG